MYKDAETKARSPQCGRENFIGFCMDLADAISKEIKKEFEICLVPDKTYGDELENGTWDGMMGQVMREVQNALSVRGVTLIFYILGCLFSTGEFWHHIHLLLLLQHLLA